MSKMDGLRAMREARYEQARARAGQAGRPAVTRTAPTAKRPDAPARVLGVVADDVAEAGSTEPTESLCGHRNMGGRTCTREAGHAAKSHRYS